MTEKEFAEEVLELKSASYNRIKRGNGKGKIIRKEVVNLTNQQIESIKIELRKSRVCREVNRLC
jgi:hypothetical protein